METGRHKIAIDIETVADERANEWWDKKPLSAPKNYKDQEKIDAYIKTARSELYDKSALNWQTGKVFSFAAVSIDRSVDDFFMYSLDEKELLTKLSELCEGKELWSKSGLDFDYGFIVGRMMLHGVKIPMCFHGFRGCKDVDNFFGFRGNGQRGSLNAYAHGLNFGGKDGDFTVVGKAYTALITQDPEADKLLAALKEYNMRDSAIVAEMVRRYYGY